MTAQRGQCRAGPAREIAVIDEQRQAGPARQTLAERQRRGRRRPGISRQPCRAAPAQVGRNQQREGGTFRPSAKTRRSDSGSALGIERDEAFGPAGPAAHELANRQRVEELVGDQQQRTVRQRVDAVGETRREVGRGGGEAALLFLPQDRARLDEVEPQGAAEFGDGPRRAQQIGHKRAAAGTEFGQDHRIGPSDALPAVDQASADQLAEYLADFGRGDEVAGSAERVALA